ncbi:right-handed parallel beta-helix repeat-containing protein [Piscinibacter defluvii]|uniref:right-handed parallel beta-helix repeat-containing protein n=1 Tax=Piscinibacter defluvii TaxID=1796922 RepID=UPI0013E3F119|nr:right-handed parallel beta-helix repeat-containing protein [Piscinibacter defluvii]
MLEVGPGQAYAVPSAAAAVARDGDVVRIAAGDYRGDVARWAANRLTICGRGGRARLFADGRSAQGKAIWVIAGNDVVVDGVDFHDTKVPDRNGAGIRTEQAGALTIRHCGFYDNENGILGGRPGATLTIEYSEFARNGHGDGYSHNLYVNDVDRLVVRASVFREARIGHQLKSRARESIVEHSYLMDGPDGRSSYLADFPDGGRVLLRGNLLHKGPKADNPRAIAFGAEGLKGDGDHLLTMVHNTLVVDHPGAHFLTVRAGAHAVTLSANLFAGRSDTELVTGGFASHRVERSAQVLLPHTALPNAGRLDAPDFWPQGLPAERLALKEPVDPAYTADTPRPMTLRRLAGPAALSGALQSAP